MTAPESIAESGGTILAEDVLPPLTTPLDYLRAIRKLWVRTNHSLILFGFCPTMRFLPYDEEGGTHASVDADDHSGRRARDV
jgi:hypothetical protein